MFEVQLKRIWSAIDAVYLQHGSGARDIVYNTGKWWVISGRFDGSVHAEIDAWSVPPVRLINLFHLCTFSIGD